MQPRKTPPAIRAYCFGVIWVDMFASELSSKSLLCFAAMGSFGPESRASIRAISRRMRVKTEGIVRDAQKELVTAGWLHLKEEAVRHSPRVWILNRSPFEHENQGYQISAPLNSRGPELRDPSNQHPKQIMIESENDIKAEKEVAEDVLSHRRAIGLYLKARAAQFKDKYKVTPKEHGLLKTFLKQGIDEKEFEAKLTGYFRSDDDFAIKLGFTLSLFLNSYNKWALDFEQAAEPRKLKVML